MYTRQCHINIFLITFLGKYICNRPNRIRWFILGQANLGSPLKKTKLYKDNRISPVKVSEQTGIDQAKWRETAKHII